MNPHERELLKHFRRLPADWQSATWRAVRGIANELERQPDSEVIAFIENRNGTPQPGIYVDVSKPRPEAAEEE